MLLFIVKDVINVIKNFLKDRFNLDEDKDDEQLIIETIRRDIHFKGTNLWTLIFAILIASIGLNVNSTAVIIGAMLISPLMGPIMGIGLGIGIIDIELMKKGIKNLLIATILGILTSSFYFAITPLQEANSELLARTTPSLWDVFIAFFGGLAGIIAGTRKNKSNIIPGVAIATALMPPLCTAGFGLATGNWVYFLGALYLYFINSVFICLATFIIVRFLNFKKTRFSAIIRQKRLLAYFLAITLLTVLPSIYLAFRIVQKEIFEQNARIFVQKEFNLPQAQVVNRNYKFNNKKSTIELILVGQELSSQTIDSIKGRMHLYNLDSNWLNIRQGLNAKNEIDLAQIKASILEDAFSAVASRDTIVTPVNKLEKQLPDLKQELKSLYPDMVEYSLSHTIIQKIDTPHYDTVTLFVARFPRNITKVEKNKMSSWLKQRTSADSLRIILER